MAIKLNGTGGMSLFHGTQARRHRFLGGVTMIETKSVPDCLKNVFTVCAGYANSIIGVRTGGVMVLVAQSSGVAASRRPTKTATPTP